MQKEPLFIFILLYQIQWKNQNNKNYYKIRFDLKGGIIFRLNRILSSAWQFKKQSRQSIAFLRLYFLEYQNFPNGISLIFPIARCQLIQDIQGKILP